jgi:hypothetical protein
MSALGHKQTLRQVSAMSALPPKADINRGERYVRFVPIADIAKVDHARDAGGAVSERQSATALVPYRSDHCEQ